MICNRKSLLALLFAVVSVIATNLSAQTNISGIINKYAAVTAIDFCNNNVTVNSTTGFSVGQRVMIIQMKGAEIDASNSAAFGNINDYKGCGNYEIDEIKSITGNVIEFKYALIRSYEAGGSVQLVSLEEYTDVVVSAPLTAQAWNGSTGGVLLLKTNTLTLNDSITVKGKGFRGALYENDNASQACFNNGTGGATDYYCATINCGAPKGEGIGTTGFNYGRGKNGNGGGGGDDHNTGGGGGSNAGVGGRGGVRSNTGNFSCPGPAPGVGGAALTYSTGANKIFMGGGGGAGDGNNNQGRGGGNGGGIVIIMCNTLTGNNKKINANGNPVDTVVTFNCCYAQSDGSGGGGGGGTVLLYADSYTGNVRVDAVGGTGGYLDNGGSNTFCMGPGGGGGGGELWVKGNSVPANIIYTDTGGINGNNKYGLGPAACPFGTTNGAQPGDDGNSLTGLEIPVDTIPFVKLVATACCDTTVCAGATVNITVTDTATFPPTILWSTGDNTSTISPSVSSSTSFIVTVTDVLHSSCTVNQTVVVTVLNTLPNVTACCDTTVCFGAYANFSVNVSTGGTFTYQWSSGETSTGITQQILGSQSFYVTVTDENGCSVEEQVIAFVSNNPPPLTVCCDTVVCAGSDVSMTATSSAQVNYVWNSGQTTSTITQPVNSSTTFTITVTDANGCIAVQSATAATSSVQTSITALPDTAILPGQTVQLTATNDSAATYNWSPASTLNNSGIYNPIASPVANTTYCVTVTNQLNCTASACLAVQVNQPDVTIKVADAFTPNSDGTNDVFTIFPIGDVEIYEIRIYNRWGEVVFYSKGNAAWDGTYEGKKQEAGAFVCKVDYGNPLTPALVKTLTKDFILIR